MFCNHCGKQNPDGARFCNFCGAPVSMPTRTCTPQPPNNCLRSPQPSKKKWYKRWWVWVLIVFGAFGFIGAVLNEILPTPRSRSNNVPATQAETDAKSETTIPTATENAAKAGKTTAVTFPAQTLYTDNRCEIKLLEGDDKTLTFSFKNKSKENYSFDIHSLAVNEVMLDFSFAGAEIPASGEAKKTFAIGKYWNPSDYDNSVIDNVAVNFWVYSEYFKDFETGVLSFEREKPEKTKFSYHVSQTHSFAGVDISVNSFEDNAITLVIENQSDSYIDYDIDNIVINGWSFDYTDIMFMTKHTENNEIFPNCQGIWQLDLSGKKLKDKEIDKLNRFEFTLSVMPKGDDMKKTESSKLTFTR